MTDDISDFVKNAMIEAGAIDNTGTIVNIILFVLLIILAGLIIFMLVKHFRSSKKNV
jgi:hypothetical protein